MYRILEGPVRDDGNVLILVLVLVLSTSTSTSTQY